MAPELLSAPEVEGYFSGGESAACFNPDRQHEGTERDLWAGFGAHVPPMAPY